MQTDLWPWIHFFRDAFRLKVEASSWHILVLQFWAYIGSAVGEGWTNSIKKKNICSAKEKENEKKKEDKSLENGEGIYWLCSRRRMNQFYWLFISSLEHAKTAEGKHQIYLSFDIELVRLYVSEQRGNSWDCFKKTWANTNTKMYYWKYCLSHTPR